MRKGDLLVRRTDGALIEVVGFKGRINDPARRVITKNPDTGRKGSSLERSLGNTYSRA